MGADKKKKPEAKKPEAKKKKPEADEKKKAVHGAKVTKQSIVEKDGKEQVQVEITATTKKGKSLTKDVALPNQKDGKLPTKYSFQIGIDGSKFPEKGPVTVKATKAEKKEEEKEEKKPAAEKEKDEKNEEKEETKEENETPEAEKKEEKKEEKKTEAEKKPEADEKKGKKETKPEKEKKGKKTKGKKSLLMQMEQIVRHGGEAEKKAEAQKELEAEKKPEADKKKKPEAKKPEADKKKPEADEKKKAVHGAKVTKQSIVEKDGKEQVQVEITATTKKGKSLTKDVALPNQKDGKLPTKYSFQIGIDGSKFPEKGPVTVKATKAEKKEEEKEE